MVREFHSASYFLENVRPVISSIFRVVQGKVERIYFTSVIGPIAVLFV